MVKSVSIHPCAKNIRDIREITSLWSVGLRQISCSKKIICNPWENTNNYPCAKTFVLFEKFVFKEKIRVHPSACKRTVLFQNFLTVLYYHSGMSASTYCTTGKVIFLAVHSLRRTYRRYAGLHVIGNLAILKYKCAILIT